MSFTRINFCILVLFFSLAVIHSTTNATEYPTPPPVPAKFENAKDLQMYLGKLHNYYMIVGRPRFGKRSFIAEEQEESNKLPLVSSTTDESQEKNDSELMNEAFALYNLLSKIFVKFLIENHFLTIF